MRACLIFNPRAGSSERIKDFLLQLTGDHRCELRPTSTPQDVKKFAREAVDDGFDRLIVAGGDGTISQAINGIAPDFEAIALAVLPFGTGNDLARSLGIVPERMEQACQIAFGDDLFSIDVIRISGPEVSYCVNVANGGFGGRVAIDIQAVDKKRWGSLAYWLTTVSRLVDLQTYDVRLSLDGQRLATPTLGVAVANGRYVGGGFPIAPEALLDDGWLDVTTIPVLPTLELMAAGINFTLGRNHRDDRVRTYRVQRLEISATPVMPFSVDGEPTRSFDTMFEVVPRALRIAAAAGAPALSNRPD